MYVVTGATGNTGSVIARTLLAKGQQVRAIGRNAEHLNALAKSGAEPFIADVGDTAALARAFNGAKGVYLMIPPDMKSRDVLAYEKRTAESLATALARSGVSHAVVLSSIGADKPDKTGPVVGLHHFEQQLNPIANTNILCIRAGYFMENTLAQVDVIKTQGIAAGPLRPDLKVPMIATRDIGAFAAERLLHLDFQGHEFRELLGNRDLNYTEVATIIGQAIGKPDLKYSQLPDAQIGQAMVQSGMSENFVGLLLEMSASLNSGYMRALESRTAQNTTPTSYETFVTEDFLPLYKSKLAAA
jgi:uncharacterized protein YbjT (DUF2867 family)